MKICIVSANLGGIDVSARLPPQVLPAGWELEFKCFGDQDLPPRPLSLSPRMQSKYPKMCAFEWFADADLIAWLDSSFTVTTSGLAAWLIEKLGDGDFCLMPHVARRNVGEELAFMTQLMASGDPYLVSRYGGEPMAEQVATYLADGNFRDEWLSANGCFVYRNTPKNHALLKDWLLECIRWTSQDQLSLSYVMHRHGVVPRWMDCSLWNSPHMKFTGHVTPAPAEAAPRADGTAFQIVQIRPQGYVHAEALTEVAECVYYGLKRLGVQAFHQTAPDRTARQIVLGAHLLDAAGLAALPADAIIYNSEQIDDDSRWLTSPYVGALKERTVWDYSNENVRRLQALGATRVQLVPVGYVPELARIPHVSDEIDVLFYGSINPRRQQILEQLKARGLNVMVLFGTYGEERDRAIARAKVVLIVHYYEAKIFEVVRAAYLLSNRKAVVAEAGPDTFVEADVREAIHAVPYDGLVEACVQLARDAPRRQELGARAHRLFAQRPEEAILATALQLPAPPSPAAAGPQAPLPATLQLGSGKDFRSDCLNVDINPAWGPDAVFDVASPTLIGSALQTQRFGTVVLAENSFDSAIANDVLEHIGDLTTAMTNVLRLLKPGGIFNIAVPYDMGLGAWQDPTHVRAFNERSWLYYTDWHWYLGWTEARFDLVSLDVEMSPLGAELQRAGRSTEDIIRIPRAVDAMRVRLRKRYLQASERAEAACRQPGPQVLRA
ncbi:MAG TPA: methyltransferase domain-containing protein [Steroidobacteraceae bacterium]|nr:methyltransferase domain-containing protein [Steroidobacteraceae bacterium]